VSCALDDLGFFSFVTCSLELNKITATGANALGSLSSSIAVDLGSRVLSNERNKARLIRQFGATPLKRFRLYICGFGGWLCLCDNMRLIFSLM
jgi:hypothetical protein